MTVAEVQGHINYNENLVAQYRNIISQLETQLRELESLRSKFQVLQNSFGNRQSNRKRKLSSVSSTKVNVKMIPIYVSAMNGLLTGSEYRSAYNGLSAAQERINSQINSIRREISDNIANLNASQSSVYYWRDQLKYATD
jgi:DNA repair exonuclease SbcCD ATPase subunit